MQILKVWFKFWVNFDVISQDILQFEVLWCGGGKAGFSSSVFWFWKHNFVFLLQRVSHGLMDSTMLIVISKGLLKLLYKVVQH